MTQQINLFTPEVEEKRGPLITAIMVVLVTAVVLAVYWQYLLGENASLQRQLAQTKTGLAAQKEILNGMKQELAKRTDPARLAAELAAVKARASESQELLAMLERGDLGTLEGYGRHLATLARMGEPGVWLTGVRIHNAGRTVELDGRSLQPESVLRYAGEFNRQFERYGASLVAVDLTPVVAADKTTTAVAFKLSGPQ